MAPRGQQEIATSRQQKIAPRGQQKVAHRGQEREQLSYNETLRLATLNCRGINEQAKRENIIKLMQKQKIDILCLQETKVATSSIEIKRYDWAKEKYTIYFSSNAKPKPKQAAKAKAAPNNKAKAQPSTTPKAALWEPLGVGMVLNEKAQKAVIDVEK
jgi:hypothetical protein